jgi:hypothetical protein
VLVAIILVFIALAIFIATDLSAWTGVVTEAPQGVANLPAYWKEIGAASILAAISFAGAGGANNLCQSNYVRDKGMGIHIPNIVSPITGEEVAAPSLGYVPPDTEENQRRFKGWWKVANQEHLLTFWFCGALLLVPLCVLVLSSICVQVSWHTQTLTRSSNFEVWAVNRPSGAEDTEQHWPVFRESRHRPCVRRCGFS